MSNSVSAHLPLHRGPDFFVLFCLCRCQAHSPDLEHTGRHPQSAFKTPPKPTNIMSKRKKNKVHHIAPGRLKLSPYLGLQLPDRSPIGREITHWAVATQRLLDAHQHTNPRWSQANSQVQTAKLLFALGGALQVRGWPAFYYILIVQISESSLIN